MSRSKVKRRCLLYCVRRDFAWFALVQRFDWKIAGVNCPVIFKTCPVVVLICCALSGGVYYEGVGQNCFVSCSRVLGGLHTSAAVLENAHMSLSRAFSARKYFVWRVRSPRPSHRRGCGAGLRRESFKRVQQAAAVLAKRSPITRTAAIGCCWQAEKSRCQAESL